MILKSKKFIAIFSVLIALILVGITAGIVFAQDGEDSEANNPVISRVAEILGIDQQQLTDAFKQAIKEQREQRLDQHLQEMIDAGKITSEQASQYREWLESRPDMPMIGHGKFSPPNRPIQQQFSSGVNTTIPDIN